MRTALAFALAFVAMSASADVSVKIDRFTGSTTYGTKLRPVYSHLAPIVTATKGADGKLSITIVLMGAFENWTYLQCHDTHWLLDGKPINLPPALHHGEVGDGMVIEDIIQKVPDLQTLGEFASASTVEWEVCNDQGQIGDANLADLRDLYGKLKQ